MGGDRGDERTRADTPASRRHTPAPGEAFQPGLTLANRYKVVRFIAAGGMGEVYEAEDLELRERVALKTLAADLAGGAARERFRREIHLARKVTHPNVCRIFDLGSHEGTPFLTMELLEGETLADRLAAKGKLGIAEALPLVEQMAAALDAAHRQDIVHRDFKPGNVIVTREGRLAVTDFGIARRAHADGEATLSQAGD